MQRLGGEMAGTSRAEHCCVLCTEAAWASLCHLPVPEHPTPLTRPSILHTAHPALSPLCWKPAYSRLKRGCLSAWAQGKTGMRVTASVVRAFTQPRSATVWDTSCYSCNEYLVLNFIARLPISDRSHWQLQLTGTGLKQHNPGDLDQTSYSLPWRKLSAPGSARCPPKFIPQYFTTKACFWESWALSPPSEWELQAYTSAWRREVFVTSFIKQTGSQVISAPILQNVYTRALHFTSQPTVEEALQLKKKKQNKTLNYCFILWVLADTRFGEASVTEAVLGVSRKARLLLAAEHPVLTWLSNYSFRLEPG